MNWIDFTTTPFADAFGKYLEALGEPDHRPNDRYELARRDGMIYIALQEANIRVALIYTDYPTADSFLRTVWFTLLWSVVPRKSVTRPNYDYGLKWSLRDTTTKLIYPPPSKGILIHEMGIEPNSSIDIVLHT